MSLYMFYHIQIFFSLLSGFVVSSNKVLQGKHGSIPESIAT